MREKFSKLIALLFVICALAGIFTACGKETGKVEVDVIFNLNYPDAPAADRPADKKVAVGGKYGALPKPDRPGFVFSGWYAEKTFDGENITADTTVEWPDDHSLFAKWTGMRVTLSYDLQGGRINNQKSIPNRFVTTGLLYSVAVPSEPDYWYGRYFTGWYLNPDGAGERIDRSTVINAPGDHVLYACYTPLKLLWDFEDASDIGYFNYTGRKMERVEFDGSYQLKFTNSSASDYSALLYLEFGTVPAGSTFQFDLTFKGYCHPGYEAGAHVTASLGGNGIWAGGGGRGAYADGRKVTVAISPNAKMSGVMIHFEFGRLAADWKDMSKPEMWQSNVFYIDNIKLSIPLPEPVKKDRYDFEDTDEIEMAANFTVTNGELKVVGEKGAKRLEVRNTSASDNTVYVYLRRPQTAAGTQISIGVDFAGVPEVAFDNRVGVYYYSVNGLGAALGPVYGKQYSDWNAFVPTRRLTFTVQPACDCDRICFVFEFGDGNTTKEQWQSRRFLISYVEAV